MRWRHDPSCLYGFKPFKSGYGRGSYFTEVFYKCKWSCDAQAFSRIWKVVEQALELEVELTTAYLSQLEIKNKLQDRGARLNKGWMSFALYNTQQKFVIASPDLLQYPSQGLALDVLLSLIPSLIEAGIVRMTKAALWKPDPTTLHTPLDVPATPDLDRLKAAYKRVGIQHGRDPLHRSIATVERQLREALEVEASINPYTI